MKTVIGADVLEIRQKLHMNQSDFWRKIGVTQSGGSRYETGRHIPKPVQHLIRLQYVENIDIDKVKNEHYSVVEYLKAHEPAVLKDLKAKVKEAKKIKK